MNEVLREIYEYIDKNSQRFVEDLIRLCKQPSISTQNVGINDCVDLVQSMMGEVGIETEIIQTKGHPMLLGLQKFEGADKTIGFYNHYDVQPPEPLELWETPPFNADIREDKIFARGVSDNKGDLIARIKAIEAIKEVVGLAPANVKFFIEGEEEIGSPNLAPSVKEHMPRIRADGYIWEGGGVDGKGRPVVSLGVKGILYTEMKAKCTVTDVHSARAPLVPNPAWRLVWALNTLKDRDERIKIAGWYEDVKPPTEEEVKLLESSPFEEEEMKERLGLKEFLLKRTGVDALKYLYFTPTCTICGFDAGYKGPGLKTVLPQEAMVKVGFRLAHAMNPDILFPKLVDHLERHGFGDVEVTKLAGYEPCKTSVDDPFARFVIEKLTEVYLDKPVVWPTSAGTSPMYTIKNRMGVPVVSGGGVGYPESRAHAPNENIRIKDYLRSIKFVATLITSF